MLIFKFKLERNERLRFFFCKRIAFKEVFFYNDNKENRVAKRKRIWYTEKE